MIFIALFLALPSPVMAQTTDIAMLSQARDRLVATLSAEDTDYTEILARSDSVTGPMEVIAGNQTLRLGQGPGWLLAVRRPEGSRPPFILAFVGRDARVDMKTAKTLPAGFASLRSAARTLPPAVLETRNQAFAFLVENLLGHSTDGYRVHAAKTMISAPSVTIPLWRKEITLNGGPGWLFFVDDLPQANWDHPCRFVLVSPDGTMTVERATTPPTNMDDFEELTSWPKADLIIQSPKDISGRTRAGSTPAARRHAVIISGGANKWSNYPRYWNDCAYFFATLKAHGFLDNNIHVLFADGTDPAPDRPDGQSSPLDFDGDGRPDIEHNATRQTVALVFDQLAATLGPEDILYIFATDHGASQEINEYPYYYPFVVLCLWGEDITGEEMAAEVNKVPAGIVVGIFEQCFSGGLVERLKGPGRVVMSASRWWEYSYAMPPNYEYDEFSFHVTRALAEPARGDSNGDGLVTMEEAYLYGLVNDGWKSELVDHSLANQGEHPSYISDPWDLGRQVTLLGRFPEAQAPRYGEYIQTETGEIFPEDPGTPMGWQADDASWPTDIPFAFPLGGRTYRTMSVSSNGILFFGSADPGPKNDVDALAQIVALAPLWDDLTTEDGDIFIASSPQEMTISWEASTYVDQVPVSTAARIRPDGSVTFLYGPASNQFTGRLTGRDKTIGLSTPRGLHLGLANGQATLRNEPGTTFWPIGLQDPAFKRLYLLTP